MLGRLVQGPGKLLFWAGEVDGDGHALLLTEQGTGSTPGPGVSQPAPTPSRDLVARLGAGWGRPG